MTRSERNANLDGPEGARRRLHSHGLRAETKMSRITASDLDLLTQWDTPTICNALEVVVPARRATGFTTGIFTVLDPKLPPVVGRARTATIRATTPPEESADELKVRRARYYEYVADASGSTIAVIEDLEAFSERVQGACVDSTSDLESEVGTTTRRISDLEAESRLFRAKQDSSETPSSRFSEDMIRFSMSEIEGAAASDAPLSMRDLKLTATSMRPEMLEAPGAALWWSIRIVLTLVGVGSVGLLALLWRQRPPSVEPGHALAVAGCLAFCFQTAVLDAVVWPFYFPV